MNDHNQGQEPQHENAVKLAPSMIAADWSQPLAVIQELAAAGCEWLHFDAMDGHLVPNITLGPMFLEALRPHSKLHFDTHLMLDNPAPYIDDFIKAGADSILVHVEGNPHLHRLIWQIKDKGKLAGVVLNPATPVEAISVILPDVDIVLVMSVNPGFSGQKFLPLAVGKMEQLCRLRAERDLKFSIMVDGGMSPETAVSAVTAGAEILVGGASSVFIKDKPLTENVRAMRDAIRLAQPLALSPDTLLARADRT